MEQKAYFKTVYITVSFFHCLIQDPNCHLFIHSWWKDWYLMNTYYMPNILDLTVTDLTVTNSLGCVQEFSTMWSYL